MADIETTAVDANGTPIVTMKVIDKETGTETPVNVSTCAEAVKCSQGIPMEQHLANLYGHKNDPTAHLGEGEKAELETKTGAQEKVTAAKNEAVAAASLLVEAAKADASQDATAKATAARDAAYRYADGIGADLDNHEENKSNPHNVTAAQVGLGNVPNKATNDLQPTYTESDTLAQLSSGERLAVAFGKIKKAVADLIAHLGNKANPHEVTASQVGALPLSGGSVTGLLKVEVSEGIASDDADGATKYIVFLSSKGHVSVGYNNEAPILLDGATLLNQASYGSTLPSSGQKGQLFFLKD